MRHYGKPSGKVVGSSAKKAKALADKENGVVYNYKPRYTPNRKKNEESNYV